MPRPKNPIATERSGWRVPEGTVALVSALKTVRPPTEAGDWTEGRVVAWAVLALAEQMARDEDRSPAERALIQERARTLRGVLHTEAAARVHRQSRGDL